jgi:hypothetical protein
MRSLSIILAILLIWLSPVLATQYATTDAGKRILLHDDGTWEYIKSPEKVLGFAHDFRKAKWGMSMDQVKKTEESPIVFEGWSDPDDATILYYKEKVFRFPAFITYIFKDSKLVQARYSFEPEGEKDYISDYEHVIEGLIEKYGEPGNVTMEWSDSTYVNDKTMWETALRHGHLKRSGIWHTKRTLIELQLFGKDNHIIMQIDYADKAYTPDSEL